MVSYTRFTLVLSTALLVLISGCGEEGLEKVVVRGTVRYAGEPIPHGQIRFFPTGGTKGPVSGGVIKDGEYVADGKGGVPVGQHRVEIYAYRPMRGAVSAAIRAEGVASEQYLPAKYNGGSRLELTITEDSGAQPIDFDLKP